MAQDYANRGKTRKPSAQRKTSGKKKSRRPFPWVALFSVIVIAGFGYGLYKLTMVEPDLAVLIPGTPDPETVENSKAVPAPMVQQPVKATEKPAPKDDDYQFYTILPDSTVVPSRVEVYEPTPRDETENNLYLLQAGSFRSFKDADRLKAQLVLSSLPNVNISEVKNANGSIWYRVRLGPFESRSALNRAQDKLVAMNLQPLQVKLKKP